MEIPEINLQQLESMTKVARGKIKTQATYQSVKADGIHRGKIDEHFRNMMELVELGLMYDVTTLPVYERVVTQYKKDNGRDLHILRPTPVGEMMFKNRRADKWIN